MSADTIKARDERDVEDAVRWAVASGKTLELTGAGSKRAIGRAAQWDLTLDLSGLNGVTLYEPQELVLTARAGTPLAEIEALLAANGQQLAFEPMDYAPLLGGPAGSSTIGGALAANLSGPRRIKAGAARDHFLGFQAVSGRGERFKSGGRVVKNVTGYDLCKVMAGSWGTLAALTEVTIKTLPRPETEATVVVLGLDAAAAARAMTAAMNSSCDVSGAAHLPAALGVRLPIGEAVGGGRTITALRLEGVAPSVTHRQDGAANAVAAVRRAGGLRGPRLARTLARDPRRHSVRGEPLRDGSFGLAHLNCAGERRRAGATHRSARGGGRDVRLGGRPHLGAARPAG